MVNVATRTTSGGVLPANVMIRPVLPSDKLPQVHEYALKYLNIACSALLPL